MEIYERHEISLLVIKHWGEWRQVLCLHMIHYINMVFCCHVMKIITHPYFYVLQDCNALQFFIYVTIPIFCIKYIISLRNNMRKSTSIIC